MVSLSIFILYNFVQKCNLSRFGHSPSPLLDCSHTQIACSPIHITLICLVVADFFVSAPMCMPFCLYNASVPYLPLRADRLSLPALQPLPHSQTPCLIPHLFSASTVTQHRHEDGHGDCSRPGPCGQPAGLSYPNG